MKGKMLENLSIHKIYKNSDIQLLFKGHWSQLLFIISTGYLILY
jgi:hypothetical protein